MESRLSQLESDVRSLRDQQSPTGSEMSDHVFGSRRGSLATYIMGDTRRESISAYQLSSAGERRESLSAYQLSSALPEPENEDFGVSPDTTDGIGSIEFTREEDSGYYGVRSFTNPALFYPHRNGVELIRSQDPLPILPSPVTFEERYMPCYPVLPRGTKAAARTPRYSTTAPTFHLGRPSTYPAPPRHARFARN